MTNRNKVLLVETITILMLALFLYTAISKGQTIESFHYSLRKSPLLSPFASWLVYVIPLAELIIAALLFFPRTRLAGFTTSLLLMVSFTAYIAYMLLFIPDLPCSCGGVLKQLTWPQHLLFNIFFTGLAYAGRWLEKSIPGNNNRINLNIIFAQKSGEARNL